MTLNLEWKLSNEPLAGIGFAIANTITEVANQQLPDLAELFPFKGNWELQGHINESWLVVRITERYGTGFPAIGELKDEELGIFKSKALPFVPRTHSEQFSLLGSDWFSFRRFTYIGPYRDSYACWPDLNQNLIDWLNNLVLPEVLKRNESRILRAIPKPPQFNLEAMRRSCWILECEESMSQGTAFYLNGTGFVTCQRVLGPKTVAFHADDIATKYPVKLIAKNETIDVAIFSIDFAEVHGLSVGSADNLKVMDHVAVAGFPNYRYGDTGVLIPGLVVCSRFSAGIWNTKDTN